MAIAALLLSTAMMAADTPPTAADIRAAVVKSLPLLTKSAAGHMANRDCFACHNQHVPILALVTARERGFAIDDGEVTKNMKFINAFLDKNRVNYLQGRGQGGQVDTAGYALWTLELGGWKANATTEAVAEYFLLYHQDTTYWRVTANRPPSEVSNFTANFLALRGLQTFGNPEQQERIHRRTRQVRDWLLRTAAKDTEDRVFRLWALRQAGAHPVEVQAAAQELLRTQRDGGGWAQTDAMEPDAYATGTALVALYDAAGLRTDDPHYQSGVRFLLKTQLDDGSWHIRSRSKPFQLYFESGFPHGKDQFISLAASGWATTALALTCDVLR
jgi:Prenyltransferase and squalene oxidase repeat